MPRHRVRIEIDGHSWLETYHDDAIRDVVVFVHGVLGNYVESWGSTPDKLKGERGLVNFDFASFGYSTAVLDRKDPTVAASLITLWLQTHLSGYERVYIVAHSMGGLITRIACGLLGASDDPEDWRMYSKIRRCFFVAVPVSGSRVAKFLDAVPGLRQLNRKLPLLAHPTLKGEDIADFYRRSISCARERGGPRPFYSHFVGELDKLVGPPSAADLTEDDRFEGYLAGAHDTIKLDKTANSTLIRRICQRIAEDAAQSAPTIRRTAPTARSDERSLRAPAAATRHVAAVRDVVLIPCSATKDTASGAPHPLSGGIRNGLADHGLVEATIGARVHIKTLIETGALEGSEFKEGNRALRAPNRRLYLGPDFGGRVNEARYLPAYRRYIGRCYQASAEEWGAFFALPEAHRPDVLIMSGLYGLYPADEHIQNYDVHLTDFDFARNCTLQELWRRVVTDVLLSRLDWLEAQGYTVGRVYDLLTEDLYRSIFDWERVARRVPVLRLMFERRQGREALDNTGLWLKTLISSPLVLQDIEPGRVYEDPAFLDQDRMTFASVTV
jgi:pimeloyl-ACP methyl ester carboxylesterase